jgi:hypothetical protein
MPRALSLRTYLSTAGASPVLIVLTVLTMFLPVVIVPYAYADDYPILRMAVSGEPDAFFGKNVLDAYAVGGRPFAGLLYTWLFSAAGTIENLRFVRLFALLTIVALALLLHWALVRAGIRRTPAALIAVLVCSLPTFQVQASWAVVSLSPLAAVLAGGASVLAVAAIDGPRQLATDRWMGATAMLLAALLIYQPAAMFFWVFLAVAVVGARDDSGRALRQTRAHLGMGGLALALAFLVTKLAVHSVGGGAGTDARSTLTHDVPGKARWFFEQPLYRSLDLFDLTPSRRLAAAVALVTAGGILVWLLQRSSRPVAYLGIAVILVPLSYLPNLVVTENAASFRSLVALSSLIALYFCLGVVGLWLTFRDWLRHRVGGRTLWAAEWAVLAFCVVFVGGSAFSAARNVSNVVAEPAMTELRMLRSQVAALPDGVTRVGFVETPYQWGMSKLATGDDFGWPTTSQSSNLEPLVLLLLHEDGRLPPHALEPTVDLLPWNTTTYPTGEPVIDVRGLRWLR